MVGFQSVLRMATLQEFESDYLPKAIAAGGFGEDVELVRVVKDSEEGKDQFASTVIFVDVELKVKGEPRTFPLVCKFQCGSAERREKFNTDIQFFNEVLVYQEIVPLFAESAKKELPRFFFGAATLNKSPKDDVIIVENLLPEGYRHTEKRLFLDFEHCCLVFKSLGAFHGASLQLKTKNQLKFANAVAKLKETRWLKKLEKDQNYFFGENAKRGVIPLIKNGESVEVLNKFLDKLNNVHELMEDILSTNDSGLLCHGDFCRNNMVFKYDEDRPVDVKLFDLATARYASPAIDLSFFLFLNTTPELRREHLHKDFFRIYLEALQNVAGEDALSKEELWKEWQLKAVYGYILAAFFIPVMTDTPTNLDENMTKLTLEERVKLNLIRGGQRVTDILTESVRDLLSWGCLN